MRTITLFILLTITAIVAFARFSTHRHEWIQPIPKPAPWPAPKQEPRPEPEEEPEEDPLSPPEYGPTQDESIQFPIGVDLLSGSDDRGVQLNWAGLSGTGLETSLLSDEGISVGLRKSFLLDDSWQGFVSGGVFLDEEEETSTTTTTDIIRRGRRHNKHGRINTTTNTIIDTDNVLRPYGQAGINYLIGDTWKLGLLYRHNFVNEDSSVDRDAVMLSIGTSF